MWQHPFWLIYGVSTNNASVLRASGQPPGHIVGPVNAEAFGRRNDACPGHSSQSSFKSLQKLTNSGEQSSSQLTAKQAVDDITAFICEILGHNDAYTNGWGGLLLDYLDDNWLFREFLEVH